MQRAELDRARLETIGQSQAQGFQTALGAAQNQQQLQAQTGLQAGAQFGQLGQALTGVGAQQQAMQQGDIQSLLQAGGVQRALGQQALEAQRATSLAQQYEPYQRVEFLKNVMTNLPTGQSSITATTAPGSNPLAQAAGAGLGAYTAYSLLKPRMKEGGLVSIKKYQTGGEVKPTPKQQEGAFTDEQKFKSMMGLGGALDPWSYREDFCGSCGIQHPNPNLLDNYPYCYCCFNTLREPYVLRKRYRGVAYYAPLDILYATYGDPMMADLAG